jgi:hypothetical protein
MTFDTSVCDHSCMYTLIIIVESDISSTLDVMTFVPYLNLLPSRFQVLLFETLFTFDRFVLKDPSQTLLELSIICRECLLNDTSISRSMHIYFSSILTKVG